MKRVAFVGLAAVLVGGLAVTAWAEALPWQQTDPNKAAPPAGAPAAGNNLKSQMDPAQYQRVITPIEIQTAQAEKVMDLLKKESEKPPAKQNAQQMLGYKMSAARCYLNAATKAKAGIALVQKEELKQAIAEQYEKPLREKAVSIYAELADAAQQKRDVRTAYDLYKQILKIDPGNASAKAAIEKIEKEAKEAVPQRKHGRSQGGGSSDNDDPAERLDQ